MQITAMKPDNRSPRFIALVLATLLCSAACQATTIITQNMAEVSDNDAHGIGLLLDQIENKKWRLMATDFLFPVFLRPTGSGFFRGLPLRSPVPHGF